MCIHNLWELSIGSFHYESEKKENKVIVFIKTSILLQLEAFWRTSSIYFVIGSDIEHINIFYNFLTSWNYFIYFFRLLAFFSVS